MLLSLMPVTILQSTVQNTFFTNLSTATFTAEERYVLGLGLNFIASPKLPEWQEINADYNRFARRVNCHDFFHHNVFEPRADAPPPDRQRFRIPNPTWSPQTSDWEPSVGVTEYVEHTRSAVRKAYDEAQSTRKTYNLSKRHRDALQRLRSRRDIIFVDADKNLGLVCLDVDDYRQRCLAELAETHNPVPVNRDPLRITRQAIRDTVLPLADSLPAWANRWVQSAVERHPRTSARYQLPNFRCTIKVHKTPAATRPITGNQKWITQPLAELVAALLQPYVESVPVWTRDSDSVNNLIDKVTAADSDLLLTYDIVRLYPSIPHELCYTL
eukprot:SAG31_NODE_5421_length_2547_cov_12.100899_1_plen_327_part_10